MMNGKSECSAPKTLRDLTNGKNVLGNQFANSKNFFECAPPEWFEAEKFERGRRFFRDFFNSILFSYFCALLVGFIVTDLSDALVFTGRSLGPDNSRRRYLETLAHLITWHEENSDIFDRNSDACKSVLFVQHLHDGVRGKIAAKANKGMDNFVSQYHTALVQSGFIGPIIMYPTDLGISASTETLEDYIHFWRVIGYTLGLRDQFNMCGGAYSDVKRICKEVEQQLIVPGLLQKNAIYNRLSLDFVNGMRVISPFITRNLVYAFICPKMGMIAPYLTFYESLLLCLMKLQFWLVSIFACYRHFCNARLRVVLNFKKQHKM